MEITGAIFDMDGTLLNSMDYWSTVADEYLQSIGIIPNEDTGHRFLTLGIKNWYEFCQKEYNLTVTFEEARTGIYSIINKHYETDVYLKEGALELLEKLSKKGVKMCLATATDRQSVELVLKRLNIEKYFLRIFTSGEVGVGKREPLIYEKALEFLGTARDTTYVFEDAPYAMRTAYTNNFKVVGVYDKNVLETEDEVKSLCHIYLDRDSHYNLDIK